MERHESFPASRLRERALHVPARRARIPIDDYLRAQDAVDKGIERLAEAQVVPATVDAHITPEVVDGRVWWTVELTNCPDKERSIIPVGPVPASHCNQALSNRQAAAGGIVTSAEVTPPPGIAAWRQDPVDQSLFPHFKVWRS